MRIGDPAAGPVRRWLTVTIPGLTAAAFLLGVARGKPTAEMVTAALALAVGGCSCRPHGTGSPPS